MSEDVNDTLRTGQTLLTRAQTSYIWAVSLCWCVCIFSIIFYLSFYIYSITLYLVLLLQESSSKGSTIYRNKTSALGHLAAQHCQLWIVPIHISHQQKWWWQPVPGPQTRVPAAPLCPWQEKGLRRAKRRKSKSPKVSGQVPGRPGKRPHRSCTSCSLDTQPHRSACSPSQHSQTLPL